ncbi:DUF3397 domain-containing protein [Streptococcus gallolyticus]|uniref:DUF3397 domain-containing protein n=1 Tax=Streptococcus hepaticus TaxID=3349163 RepID=UPI001C938179|nr:DUF3397 domain-containing protein [Streptococcus gallolyticus]MBY5041708.1 DUF3397 domain-containing protein [Streptococcus gallolyticus]
MILLKIAAILFLILSLTISVILVKLLGLRKKGLNFADIAFPLFICEFYLISDKAYYHSQLPLLGLALGILALGICSYMVFKKQEFEPRRFFKLFWRAGFILTFLMYLALVISIFFMK